MAYAEELFSDLYKDVYGSRPSASHSFYSADAATKQAIWDKLTAELDNLLQQEAEEAKAATIQFNQRIEQEMLSNNCSRDQAIVTLVKKAIGEDEYDAGYVCYLLDLPYSWELQIEQAFAEIAQ